MYMFKFIGYNIILIALVLGIFAGVDACAGTLTNPEKAISLLKELGYTNIEVIDRDTWFVYFKGGDVSDNAIYTINATLPGRYETTVQVFEGWPFKAATLRGR